MMDIKNQQVVSRDPQVMSGALVFAGTRVPVQTLIDYIADGDGLEDFLEGFPTVSREQAIVFLIQGMEALSQQTG